MLDTLTRVRTVARLGSMLTTWAGCWKLSICSICAISTSLGLPSLARAASTSSQLRARWGRASCVYLVR